MNNMTPKEALELLDRLVSQMTLTRDQHLAVAGAVQALMPLVQEAPPEPEAGS